MNYGIFKDFDILDQTNVEEYMDSYIFPVLNYKINQIGVVVKSIIASVDDIYLKYSTEPNSTIALDFIGEDKALYSIYYDKLKNEFGLARIIDKYAVDELDVFKRHEKIADCDPTDLLYFHDGISEKIVGTKFRLIEKVK